MSNDQTINEIQKNGSNNRRAEVENNLGYLYSKSKDAFRFIGVALVAIFVIIFIFLSKTCKTLKDNYKFIFYSVRLILLSILALILLCISVIIFHDKTNGESSYYGDFIKELSKQILLFAMRRPDSRRN